MFILFTIFLGFLGIHKFYQKKYLSGVLYLFSYGLFFFGWGYDVIRIILGYDGYIIIKPRTVLQSEEKSILKKSPPADYYKEEKLTANYEKYYGLPQDFVVLDFETTGFNPKTNKIIQIGAIKFKDFVKIDEYETYINPGVKIPKKITEKTGIDDDDVEFAPDIEDEIPELISFISGLPIIAHNASFDISFLLVNSLEAGIIPPVYNVVDTLPLARKHIKDSENHKLETLKSYLKLDENYDSHNALDDCMVTSILYKYCYDKTLEKFQGIAREAYDLVKKILKKGGRCLDYLRVFESTNKYIVISYFSELLTIKNGKKFYFLDERSREELEEFGFTVEAGTQTEKHRHRVMISCIEDINKFEDIILKRYEEALTNIEFAKKYNPDALKYLFL